MLKIAANLKLLEYEIMIRQYLYEGVSQRGDTQKKKNPKKQKKQLLLKDLAKGVETAFALQ